MQAAYCRVCILNGVTHYDKCEWRAMGSGTSIGRTFRRCKRCATKPGSLEEHCPDGKCKWSATRFGHLVEYFHRGCRRRTAKSGAPVEHFSAEGVGGVLQDLELE